jgi:hypothetical protein
MRIKIYTRKLYLVILLCIGSFSCIGDTFIMPLSGYSHNYYVHHISRDSLIAELDSSMLDVNHSSYHGHQFSNEHTEIHNLNDTIEDIVMRIQAYDSTTQTVRINFGGIYYNPKIIKEGNGRKLDYQTRMMLLRCFEREMLKIFGERIIPERFYDVR